MSRKFWVRKTSFHEKHSFQNLTLIDWPDVKSQAALRHRVKWPSLSTLTWNWPRKGVSHDILLIFIFSDLLWPDLDLFKYDRCTHAATFLDISAFGWAWPICGPSNWPWAQNAKTRYSDIWLDFDLTHKTLILKCPRGSDASRREPSNAFWPVLLQRLVSKRIWANGHLLSPQSMTLG